MTRYIPARHYRWFGMSAVALAGLCAWLGTELRIAFVPAGLFLLTAGLLFLLAFRPTIEIHEGYVAVGGRIIPWMDIRRLDRTGWISPLIIRPTLFDDSRLLLEYPRALYSFNTLLRHPRRLSRDDLIDYIPYTH